MIIQERENEFTAPLMDYFEEFIQVSVASRESQNQPEQVSCWIISNDWPSVTKQFRNAG